MCAEADERGDRDRADALEVRGAFARVLGHVGGLSAARWSDHDLAGVGLGLKPRGQIDDGADRHLLAQVDGVEVDERLAGLDADPHIPRDDGAAAPRGPLRAVDRGPERALWVVGVRDRRAEDDEDRVSDVLLDRPAFPLEDALQIRE